MDPQTEALARRALDDFNRVFGEGRFEVEEEMRDLWVEDPVIMPMRSVLEGTVYRGPTALDDLNADNKEVWECLRVEPARLRELADGSVLIHVHMTAVARDSGIETSGPLFMHMTVRDGRIASMRTFLSEEDALRQVEA